MTRSTKGAAAPKLPFECSIYDAEPQLITNPFSGESIMLTPDAIAVYDTVMGANMVGLYDIVRKGTAWFRKYYPKEYMVLLD
jgi:hypothetical protein